MAQKDYYKILGVNRSSSNAEIKKQYRRLARKYHPDVSKEANAEARFKEINEAYDILKDKEKRSNYDRFGSADSNPFGGGGFTPPPGAGGWNKGNFGGFNQGSFSDIFDNMFNGARSGRFNDNHSSQQKPQGQNRGQDNNVVIHVDLEDAFHGANRTIKLHIPGETGARKLKIKIPKGIKQGQKIRLGGQGGKGHHRNGDLLLEVKFNKHRYFTVNGKDISLTLPITPWEAALGTKVSIPTLGGTVDIKLPPNTQSGKKLRLKGRGLPGKESGNQYVLLQIMTPEANTDQLRKLYQEMAELSAFNPRKDFT